MPDPSCEPGLHGRHILLVEDEYLIADELAQAIERKGAVVIGPAPTVERALALVHLDKPIDAAILDINLQGNAVFPVAEALRMRGVPFLFASGYGRSAIPNTYRDAPACEKPVPPDEIIRILLGLPMQS